MSSSESFYLDWCQTPLNMANEKSWKIGSRNLCFSWESPLMAEFAKQTCTADAHLLEIGFGMGIFAGFVQNYGVKKHSIIENHPQVYHQARKWAANLTTDVDLQLGSWQVLMADFDQIDAIMYDAISEPGQKESDFELLFQISSLKLKQNGKLAFFCADPTLDRYLENLASLYFSDISLFEVEGLTPCSIFKNRGIKSTMLVPVLTK